ncbi:hypothetical protein BJS_03450 [Bradyrhizobium japonicum SEMIA 5079]|nr:hypothetical protein BJS_03450 [Bradyrhizobium japonicum SEMIA 5079]
MRGATNFGGRQHFAGVSETPADGGKAAPIGTGHLGLGRRRAAAHDVRRSHLDPPQGDPDCDVGTAGEKTAQRPHRALSRSGNILLDSGHGRASLAWFLLAPGY